MAKWLFYGGFLAIKMIFNPPFSPYHQPGHFWFRPKFGQNGGLPACLIPRGWGDCTFFLRHGGEWAREGDTYYYNEISRCMALAEYERVKQTNIINAVQPQNIIFIPIIIVQINGCITNCDGGKCFSDVICKPRKRHSIP